MLLKNVLQVIVCLKVLVILRRICYFLLHSNLLLFTKYNAKETHTSHHYNILVEYCMIISRPYLSRLKLESLLYLFWRHNGRLYTMWHYTHILFKICGGILFKEFNCKFPKIWRLAYNPKPQSVHKNPQQGKIAIRCPRRASAAEISRHRKSRRRRRVGVGLKRKSRRLTSKEDCFAAAQPACLHTCSLAIAPDHRHRRRRK